jgi:2-iminobutanoate/2-iminopropanoate deaminase
MLKVTSTDKAPAAIGPYSQAISAGGFLFTSGQIPLDPVSGEITGADINAQTEQVIKNLEAILKANNIGLEKVIKTTCFLAYMEDFAAFNKVYEKFFISKPARSTVAVKQLPRKVLCEIEAVAEL